MALRTVFLDFETFYDQEYSLTKMTPAEYALDSRFEALGCAFIMDGGEPFWVDGPDLPNFFARINWQEVFAVSHNALFDFAVLKWQYGVVPALIGDSMAMARAWLYGKIGSIALASCARYFGLPPKGQTVFKMKGIGFAAMKALPNLDMEFKEYGKHDAFLCKEVFYRILAEGFPVAQLEVIDMQCRMCVEPRFVYDWTLLSEYLNEVRAEKQLLLDQVGQLNSENLLSNEKFAEMLMAEGVAPPTKVSKATGEETWAFSKQDSEFMDLLEHENPRVQALMAARLGWKSTMEETRTETFLRIAALPWRNELPLSAPIPLKYSGAWTHRFSGDWSLNKQNLKRGGKLRDALCAPPGYAVLSADASQIEARMTAEFCGQEDLVKAFAEGRDVYAEFASELFGKPVNKKDNPAERFIGKTAVLQLGYGAGWMSLQTQIRVNSKNDPSMGEMRLPDEECWRIVNFYRGKNAKIAGMWKRLDLVLVSMADGECFDLGPLKIEGPTIWLPNGMPLRYNDLHQSDKYGNKTQWFYRHGRQEKVIYGAKVLENAIQSLAFIHIIESACRIKRKSGGVLMPKHQVHDELIYIQPVTWADALKPVIVNELSARPAWMPGVPLAAEAGAGPSYGKAK